MFPLAFILPFFGALFTKIVESVLFQIAVDYCLKLAAKIPGLKQHAETKIESRKDKHAKKKVKPKFKNHK
jgi:hypothetical protein